MSKPLLDVLKKQKAKQRPVWLMRQAGRYLPEYRQIRNRTKNFLTLCLTPDLATEVTLQPLRRFDMDAAILFADILLIPYALGAKLEFREGEGPHLNKAERDYLLTDLTYDAEKVKSVFETVESVKTQLLPDKTLIGFSGSPWTVACYMIDGSSHQNFSEALLWTKAKPEQLDQLLLIIEKASLQYLLSQIKAGADVIQLFDSWAGLLQGEAFTRWVINPTERLITSLRKIYPTIPIIGFPREAKNEYARYARNTSIDALSIDQHVSLTTAQRELQTIKPLQGNLDPALLVEGGEKMREALRSIMDTLGPHHIINLGHGVPQETPPDHVGDLVKYVHQYGVGL